MSDLLNNSNFIFKYAPFNVNTLKLLIKGELWFGEPRNQNDPFEGEFIIDDFKERISPSILEQIKKEVNPDTHPDWFKYVYDDNSEKDIENDYTEYLKNILRADYGISSFSQKFNSTLMWSHYANSHKGICMVFDKKTLNQSIRKEHKDVFMDQVNYSYEIPQIKLGIQKNGYPSINGYEVFKFKLKDFLKEEEIRFIKYFNPKFNDERTIKFDKTALKGIIFGERMPLDDKRTIVHIIESNKEYSSLIFFKAFKDIKSLNMKTIQIHPKHDEYVDIYRDFGAYRSISGQIIPKKAN